MSFIIYLGYLLPSLYVVELSVYNIFTSKSYTQILNNLLLTLFIPSPLTNDKMESPPHIYSVSLDTKRTHTKRIQHNYWLLLSLSSLIIIVFYSIVYIVYSLRFVFSTFKWKCTFLFILLIVLKNLWYRVFKRQTAFKNQTILCVYLHCVFVSSLFLPWYDCAATFLFSMAVLCSVHDE